MFKTIATIATLAAAALGFASPSSADTAWHSTVKKDAAEATYYETHGNPANWSYVFGTAQDSPAWNPCAVITWSAPADLVEATSAAVNQVHRFSGLNFAHVASGADISVVWGDRAYMASIGAVGVTEHTYSKRSDGRQWMLSAVVRVSPQAIDAGHPLSTAENLRFVAMHEFGHVVGLGHVRSFDEIMGSGVWWHYGLGDKNGLAHMNRGACAPPLPPTCSKGQFCPPPARVRTSTVR